MEGGEFLIEVMSVITLALPTVGLAGMQGGIIR